MAVPIPYLCFLLVLNNFLCGCFGYELGVQLVIVALGSTINLTCTDHSCNNNVWEARRNWFFSRSKPAGPQDVQRTLVQGQACYTIKEAAYKDSGYYRCTDPSPVNASLIRVIVGSAPIITNRFDFATRQFKLMDNQHTLQCFAKGIPRPRVKWYQNGVKLSSNSYYNITTKKMKRSANGMVEVQVKLTFLVWNSEVDKGLYECRATNSFGSVNESTALEQSDRPKHHPVDNLIANSSSNKEINYGQNDFLLACISDRGYLYYLHWEKNGMRVLEDCDNSSTLTAGSVCQRLQFVPGSEVVQLLFGPIRGKSEGVYQCVGTPRNNGISIADKVTLKVTGLPGTPHVTAVDRGNSSAIYTEQDVNDNGFLKIICSFQYIEEKNDRPVDMEWLSPSGVIIPAIQLSDVVSVLEGNNESKSREVFSVKQQEQQSAILYIPGDRLAKFQGNYTCRASSRYYDTSVILRRVQVMMSQVMSEPVGTQTLPADISVAVAIVAFAVVATALLICYKWQFYQKANKQRKIVKNFMDVQTVAMVISSNCTWKIPKQNVNLVNMIGAGFFGTVWQAEVSGIAGLGKKSTAAVKTVKDEADQEAHNTLASEGSLLMKVGRHENVVQLFGFCVADAGLWLVMEFAEHGNLQSYLRSKRLHNGVTPPASTSTCISLGSCNSDGPGASQSCLPVSERLLFDFSFQVAKGMAHLISKKCIHRDLAARNVLVCSGNILKVSDFGLSKDVRYTDYYRKTSQAALPLKWTSPEALLHKIYTEASDVWSFGILLWEIATLGGSPYPGIPVDRLYDLLTTSSYRMSRPVSCPQKLHEMMIACWDSIPENRPQFHELVGKMSNILSEFDMSAASLCSDSLSFDDNSNLLVPGHPL